MFPFSRYFQTKHEFQYFSCLKSFNHIACSFWKNSMARMLNTFISTNSFICISGKHFMKIKRQSSLLHDFKSLLTTAK